MRRLYVVFGTLLSICLLYGCLDEPDMPGQPVNISKPTITLTDPPVGEIKAESVRVSAKITKHNGSKTVEQGYYVEEYTEASDRKKEKVSVTGKAAQNGVITFDTVIGGLSPAREYIVSAFARNEAGESEVVIDTLATPDGLGAVRLLQPDDADIRGSYAKVSAELTDEGEGEIEERGFYYALVKDSLLSGTAVNDSVYTTEKENPYSCTLSPLEEDTKYYFRAYIKNQYGIFRSVDADSLTTKGKKPAVSTPSVVGSVRFREATLTADVTYEGDSPVEKRGMCWSKLETHLPVIDGNEVYAGEGGTGAFTVKLTGLDPATTYYVRAFAQNREGIVSYSESAVSFQTLNAIPQIEIETIKEEEIAGISAKVSADIVDKGEGEITERGFYFALSKEILAGNSTADSVYVTTNENPYACTLKPLVPESKYYIQAYVKNQSGIFRSMKIDSLTTKEGKPFVGLPSLTEPAGFTIARLTAQVINEGDMPVEKRGICWSKLETHLPVIDGNEVYASEGGTGQFTVELTGLEPETKYYARAFASNGIGISYSEEVFSFSTLDSKPVVESGSATTLKNGALTMEGSVLSQGQTPVEAAGICWSVTPNPTVENDTVICLSGEGSFNGTVKGLKGGTTYYLRAYATNQAGTSYGAQVTQKTPALFHIESETLTQGNYTPHTPAYLSLDDRAGYILGGDIGSTYTDQLWVYFLSEGRWLDKKRFEGGKRKWQTAVATGLEFCVLGGIDIQGTLFDDIYVYSPGSNEWREVSSGAFSGRHSAAGASVGGTAFFIGGYGATGAVEEVWSYESTEGTVRKNDFPVAQYGGIAVHINGAIYAGLGKPNEAGFSNKLWSSSDGCDTWIPETDFPKPADKISGGVALNEYIYVIDNNATIWRYDTIQKEWEKKSVLPAGYKSFHCMFKIQDYIYIGLGDNSQTLLRYDPYWDN